METGTVQPRPGSANSERYTYMSTFKDKPKETTNEINPPTYEEHVQRRAGHSTPSPTNVSLTLGQGAPSGQILLQDDQGKGVESEEEGYLKPTGSRKTAAVKPAPRVHGGGMQMEMVSLHHPAQGGRQEGTSLAQNSVAMPGQNIRGGQLQSVPMGLHRDGPGVPNNTPAAPDGHLILRPPRDRRSLQGVDNVVYHQYEELPHREVDVGGVVLGVGGQAGGFADGPQESPYAQIGDSQRTSSKRKPNPLYISGSPARWKSTEKGSGRCCGRCQDRWRTFLIPALLFLFCVVAVLLALVALANAVSRQAGASDQGAESGGTAAQTGDTCTSVLTTQLAAALGRIQQLELQNQQLVAQLSVLDNQTMVRQDDLQNQLSELERKQNTGLQNLSSVVERQDEALQAAEQKILSVGATLQTELSLLNSSVLAELDVVSKMEGPQGPRGYNGSQGDKGETGANGTDGASGVSELDKCKYDSYLATSGNFLGATELDWIPPEANHTMIGVHCTTEGGSYTELEHRTVDDKSQYRCICKGEVTDAAIVFQGRKCTIHWWSCPTS